MYFANWWQMGPGVCVALIIFGKPPMHWLQWHQINHDHIWFWSPTCTTCPWHCPCPEVLHFYLTYLPFPEEKKLKVGGTRHIQLWIANSTQLVHQVVCMHNKKTNGFSSTFGLNLWHNTDIDYVQQNWILGCNRCVSQFPRQQHNLSSVQYVCQFAYQPVNYLNLCHLSDKVWLLKALSGKYTHMLNSECTQSSNSIKSMRWTFWRKCGKADPTILKL